MKRIILIIILLSLTPDYSYSRVWYIKDDGTGDAPSISAGIDSCSVGDTVLVAPGTYIPTAAIYIDFDTVDSIFVISESGPSNTIVDCVIAGFGFYLEGYSSKYLLISGFDIRNASAAAIAINICYSGTISVENNVIHNSYCGIGMDLSSEVIIRKNLIYSNQIGVLCTSSAPIHIIENTIAYHVGEWASGIVLETAYQGNVIRNNIICNNESIREVTRDNSIFECNNIFNNTENLDSFIGVDGNFATDPEFCSQTPEVDENFFLQSDSPCIPGNHPDGDACGIIGCRSSDCGVTGIDERSWGDIKKLMKPSSKSR